MVRDERIEEVRAKAELNAEERLLDLLLPPRPAAPDEDPGRVRDEMSGTRQRMREQLRDGKLDDRMVEIDVQEKSFPSIELITGIVDGGSRRQPARHDARPVPGPIEAPPRHGGRSARAADRRRRAEADRHGRGAPAPRSSASSRPASSSSTRSTRSPAARAATARTSAAKACSATSCRSSKARPSTPSTAWCGPITSCSSPPARSTSRSRRT